MLNLKILSYLKSKQSLGIFLLVVIILGGVITDNHQLNIFIHQLKAILSAVLLDVGQSLIRASSAI